MKLGFTGTREGMTGKQRSSVHGLIVDLLYEWRIPHERRSLHGAHHGDCIGADTQFHHLMHSVCETFAHRGPAGRYAANCDADVKLPRKPYLARNRDIVDATEILIAAPKGPEERRSGTWATVRYARKLGRPVAIVWPDGRVEWERRK